MKVLTRFPVLDEYADAESRLAADFGPAPQGALAGVVEQLVAAGLLEVTEVSA